MKTFTEIFRTELEQEAAITRKMLAAVPNDKYDWQPHPKSMTIGRLVTHIAELPEWVAMAMVTDELDFAANPYEPEFATNNAQALADLEKNLANALAKLTPEQEISMDDKWVLRNGDYIIQEYTKAEVIRMSISQTIHHRAQLGVFLRLLNVPIPGSYGPSADELELQKEMMA
ncbi:DinB family protein [Mucilaginibacter sp. HMF5004]|uniref:DinB family protein n=1 Tax=Mucilaginibacter rivuli TaxID=2857527 RepID=UPI001C5EF85A|nr:DinB family protein [Mucilaginibacter rivuli]MBW4888613.1 DinB family protein [Mucilaginibacter rivuli]